MRRKAVPFQNIDLIVVALSLVAAVLFGILIPLPGIFLYLAFFTLFAFLLFLAFEFKEAAIFVATFVSFGLGVFPWHRLGISSNRKTFYLVLIGGLFFWRLISESSFFRLVSKKVVALIPIGFFYLAMLLASLHTNAPDYGQQKLFLFLLIFPEMIFFSSFLQEKQDFERVQTAILWAGVVGMLAFVLNVYDRGETITRFGVRGNEGVLSLARLFGICAFTAFTRFFKQEKRALNLFHLVLALTFIGFLIGTGTRQAFFSLFGGGLVFLLILSRGGLIKVNQITLLIISFVLLPVIWSSAHWLPLIIGGERIFSFAQELFRYPFSTFASIDRVEKFFPIAYSLFLRFPLKGGGLGSFSIYYFGVDARAYPHNIFLEILSEMGLLGFIPFLIILMLIARKLYKQVRTKHDHILYQLSWLTGIWMIAFLNAQFTGDIIFNRFFWIFSILLLSFCLGKSDLNDRN